MCIWCKLPLWTRESQCCFLWNHRKSVMHTCEVFCGLETCNLHSICVPSTPSHWLICSRRRSSFLRVYLMQGFWYPRWWFPTWTRKCFIIRLPRDPVCLGQHVHMIVAEPAHALELTIVVHFPRISQRHLVDLCCKLSFFFLLDESGISWHQPDLNLGQVWWLECFPRTIILVSVTR